MSEYPMFHEISTENTEFEVTQVQSRTSVSPLVASCCKNLQAKFMGYSDYVDDMNEHIDEPDSMSGRLPLKNEGANTIWLAALADVAECPVKTWADITCKQVSMEPWMEFSRRHPGLMDQIITGLFRDVAQVARRQASNRTAWKFPTVLFPASWSIRLKPRPANGSQS